MILIINYLIQLFFGLNWLYPQRDINEPRSATYNQKMKYCWSMGILLILLSGLRSLRVGADTAEYYRSYMEISRMSWQKVFMPAVMKYAYGIEGIRDPGYAVFQKCTQILGTDYQVYLMLIACLFMIPFVKLVLRESKCPTISFCLYSALFYGFFSITGIRQTIATAFTVLVGDQLVKKRKLLPFVLIVLLSSTIHKSALVFLPFYFLSRIPVNKGTAFCSIFLVVFSFVFRNQLKMVFIDVSGYTDYVNAYENAGTYTFTFLLAILFIMSFFAMESDSELRDNNRFYIALYLAMFFTPLTWINPSAMRIVQYFSIYLVILIPEMIDCVFSKNSQFLARGAVVIVLLLLLLKGNPQYQFFWELNW